MAAIHNTPICRSGAPYLMYCAHGVDQDRRGCSVLKGVEQDLAHSGGCIELKSRVSAFTSVSKRGKTRMNDNNGAFVWVLRRAFNRGLAHL